MTDERITEETAKLAKEKGFDNGCEYLWGTYEDYVGLHHVDNYNRMNEDNQYSAPTQSLLQRWLREIHHIQVYAYSRTVKSTNMIQIYRDYVVYINGNALNDARDEEYQTYELALEFGLKEALKHIS